jgi:hypothetical protein
MTKRTLANGGDLTSADCLAVETCHGLRVVAPSGCAMPKRPKAKGGTPYPFLEKTVRALPIQLRHEERSP